MLTVSCSYKPMADMDYGQFVQRMRKSRGFTQEQIVSASGVSVSTVSALESSGDRIVIRPANLDAILTALAMRGFLGPSEIKVLCEATGRVWESFEDLNFRAEKLKNESSTDLRTRPKSKEPDFEERFLIAARTLSGTAQGQTALTMLEALAAQLGNQLAAESRAPKSTKGAHKRTLRVAYPSVEGPTPGSTQQETVEYEVDDDPAGVDSQSKPNPDTLDQPNLKRGPSS